MLRFFVLVVVFAVSVKSFAASETEFFTRADSTSKSDALPLKSYLNNLKGPPPKSGGSYFLTRNNIEFGMGWQGWELAFFHRNDYNLGFHFDTIDYSYNHKNRIKIPQDTDYRVLVTANQYQLTGLKLLHEFPVLDGVKISVGGSYFHASESVSGYLGGYEDGSGGVVRRTRIFVPPNKYRIDLAGNLHTDYHFTDDPLFRTEVEAPTGQGYSIDLGASWQVKENLLFTLRVDDALGAIYWYDLPYITADGTSAVFVEGEDGLFESTPAFEGNLKEKDFIQDLTRRSRLNVHYDLNKYYMGYEYDDMGLAAFHRVIGGYQFTKNWGSRLGVDMGSGATEFTLIAPVGIFKLMFDSTDLGKAYNLGFSWSMHFPID